MLGKLASRVLAEMGSRGVAGPCRYVARVYQKKKGKPPEERSKRWGGLSLLLSRSERDKSEAAGGQKRERKD